MPTIKHYTHPEPYTTESGFMFPEQVFAYHSWGTLNKERDNVVLIFHALTGDSNAEDWFSGFFSEQSPIDLERDYVLCINTPGSCYGSLGPQSLCPDTGHMYGSRFPVLTIRDIVRIEQRLLDHLDIQSIRCVIGGSMGGMIALEFALMDQRVQKAFLIAMGKEHTAWAIGLSHLQRNALYQDPNWKQGDYLPGHEPNQGLSLARQIGMMSYRSPKNYEEKFGRHLQDTSKTKQSNETSSSKEETPFNPYYAVESYLDYQGKKLVNRFDALSYERLTRSMDTHDISRNRGSFEEVGAQCSIPIKVIGINSDALYSAEEQKDLASLFPKGEYSLLDSPYGHDAFLIEFSWLIAELERFLAR